MAACYQATIAPAARRYYTRFVELLNRIESTVKKVRQVHDEKKNEHVIYLDYRVRVRPDGMNVPGPGLRRCDCRLRRDQHESDDE